MNDPHVVALSYVLISNSDIVFESPPALHKDFGTFAIKLHENVLRAEMKDHFETEDRARLHVESRLRAWEVAEGLKRGAWSIRFQFQGSEITDRNPPPDRKSSNTVSKVMVMLWMTDSVRHQVTYHAYPSPPEGFEASHEVTAMWQRFESYKQGREPLLAMAYACLSLLEGTTGKKKGAREAACQKYGIERDVRDVLGDLVSQKGGVDEARKLDWEATRIPLTDKEKVWIEEVVKALIFRKAAHDAAPTATFPLIELNQFIPL